VTAPDEIDWPWPEQIAGGHFQKRKHRVRPSALTIELDGVIYHSADCGAIAIPTGDPPDDWDFCASCWPCGVRVVTAPPYVPTPPTPVSLPDCLNWKAATGAYSPPPRRPRPLRAGMASATGVRDIGWCETSA
jgi:hypothetical protein